MMVSEIGNDTGTAASAVPCARSSSTQLSIIRTRTFGLGLTEPGRTYWKRREGLPHHPTLLKTGSTRFAGVRQQIL
jgi:hypothetical protein